MAKATFIWWDEFDRGELPCLCMRCGTKKAKWVAHTFEKIQRMGRDKYRKSRAVEMPLCRDHRDDTFKTDGFEGVEFNDKGAWLDEIDGDFIAALKKHRKAEIKAWKAEMDDANPENHDNDSLPPGLRKAPKLPPKPTAKPFLIIAALILLPLLLIGCLAAGAVAVFLFSF